LVFLTGCPKNVEPEKNCIERVKICKKTFNVVREDIAKNILIPKNDIIVTFYPLEKALNGELNLILKKTRENDGNPYDSCDKEVDVFCSEVEQYRNMGNKYIITTTTSI